MEDGAELEQDIELFHEVAEHYWSRGELGDVERDLFHRPQPLSLSMHRQDVLRRDAESAVLTQKQPVSFTLERPAGKDADSWGLRAESSSSDLPSVWSARGIRLSLISGKWLR